MQLQHSLRLVFAVLLLVSTAVPSKSEEAFSIVRTLDLKSKPARAIQKALDVRARAGGVSLSLSSISAISNLYIASSSVYKIPMSYPTGDEIVYILYNPIIDVYSTCFTDNSGEYFCYILKARSLAKAIRYSEKPGTLMEVTYSDRPNLTSKVIDKIKNDDVDFINSIEDIDDGKGDDDSVVRRVMLQYAYQVVAEKHPCFSGAAKYLANQPFMTDVKSSQTFFWPAFFLGASGERYIVFADAPFARNFVYVRLRDRQACSFDGAYLYTVR